MIMNDQVEVLNSGKNPTISLNNETYFAVSLYNEKIFDEKDLIKFIKNVEKVVRSSPEYRNLISYMKDELNLNACTYLNALNSELVSIELHHTPYNLHQIVEIIILKNEAKNIPYNSFSVAMEVIELHYRNYIGLVSLSKSIHELVHSDERFHIHKDLVIGDVDAFYHKYKDFMTEDHRYVYKSWIKYSDENPADALNTLELYDQDTRKEQLSITKNVNKTYTIGSNIPKEVIKNKQEQLPEVEF